MPKRPATAAEKRHMDRVAKLPCAMCYVLGQITRGVHVHHVREDQGMGERAPNFLAIPLCPDCHQGPNGIHGNRTYLRIAKMTELDLLAITIEMLMEGMYVRGDGGDLDDCGSDGVRVRMLENLADQG